MFCSRRGKRFTDSVTCPGRSITGTNWHYDVIEEFTTGRIPMQSDLAPIQAFRVAGNHFGVQFHPEIDLKTVRHLVASGAHRLNDLGAQSALDQIVTHRRYARQNAARLSAELVR